MNKNCIDILNNIYLKLLNMSKTKTLTKIKIKSEYIKLKTNSKYD